MLIAARDYKKRHPESLLVSVDTRLARLWLRLSDTGERCDLLGLRDEDGTMVVDAVEVKTAGTGGDAVARAEIDKATAQLSSTLAAIQMGLEENESSTPLAAPRQEMLKEVFVSGCQAPRVTREDRERWVEWLRVLFNEIEGASETQLRGTVYAVELSHNGPPEEEALHTRPHPIQLRRVRETQIQELLSPEALPIRTAAMMAAILRRPPTSPLPRPRLRSIRPPNRRRGTPPKRRAIQLLLDPGAAPASGRARRRSLTRAWGSASRSANVLPGMRKHPYSCTRATPGSRSSISVSSATSGPARPN